MGERTTVRRVSSGKAGASVRWLAAWLVFAGIAVATIVYFALVLLPSERAAAIEQWRGRLSAMADDRKVAIAAWLDERRGNASVVAAYPTIAALLGGRDGLSVAPPQAETQQYHLRGLLDSVQAAYGYDGIYVVDASGQVRVSSTGSVPLGASCRKYIERVLQSGEEQVDFHSHEDGSPRLAVVAPVLAGGKPIGTVLLSMDPGRWLYPLLHSEPIPSRSAESLLGRRVGDEIQYLSPLRHRSGPPMSFRLPISGAPLAVVAAIGGEEGFKDYPDYRGIPVLGATRHIPGTGWGLVVKVDRDETLVGFRRNVRQGALAIAGLLLAVAGLGFGAQRALAARHRRELGESEARFALLRDHANDAILFSTRDGVILDANRQAEVFHGRAPGELAGKRLDDLRAPEERAALRRQLEEVAHGEHLVFETVHLRRDGTLFPVEVSKRLVQLDGAEVFLSIVRDISERKRHEARITQLNRLLRTISEINQLVVRERDRDRLLAEACRIVVEHGGFHMAWIGFVDEATGTVVPAASAGIEDGFLGSITFRYDDTPLAQSPVGRAIRAGRSVVVNDWDADERMAPWREAARDQGYRSSAAFVLKVRARVVGAFTVYSAFADRFDDESASLLEELAGDIGFALETMDTETRRRTAEEAMAAQHSTLKGITESTAAAVFSVDREYRYTSFNGSHAAVMKALYGVDVALGRSLLTSMTVEEDRRQAKLNIDRALAGERFVTEAASGDEALTRTFFEVSHNPIRHADGTVIGVAVFAADVSERRRAEEALQESKGLMQDVLDNSSALIYIIDTEGRILLANSRLESVLGAPRAVLRGKTRHELMPKAIADQHRANDLRVIAEGHSIAAEETTEEPDGKHVYSTVKFPLRDGQGKIYAIGGMSTDVTDRRRAEAELRSSEERFRRAVTDSPFPALLHAEDGTIIQVSNAWCEITGYPPAELATIADWTERAYGERKELVQADIDVLYGLDRPKAEGDYSIRTKAGGIRIWDFSSAPLGRLPDGRRLVLSMAMDVTERRQAESEVRRLNDELEERVRQRTAQLETANKELEAFSYSVSHDLRAPLRAIDGFSRIVLDDYGARLDDEGRRQLGVIRANTQKMGRLIDDLLAFSRAGRAALTCSRVAVANVVRAAFDEVAIGPEEQGRIDLVVDELPDAWADPVLIHQVWVNLLSNAVKFSRTRERAAIRVTGARDDHRVVYHVSDNGVGFDMRYVGKLFSVFQRLHSSREFEGTGIGLALVQRILHRHGGEVWAEGTVDSGATFSFALPEEAGHG
jgi:PAS domain S-box-containing protein